MMRPFRVLVIDDELANQLRPYKTNQSRTNWAKRAVAGYGLLLRRLLEMANGVGQEEPLGNMELFTTGEISFNLNTRNGPVNTFAGSPPQLDSEEQVDAFLRSIDVLALDVKGVGESKRFQVTADDLPPDLPVPTEEDLHELNGVFSGAGFFLKLRNDQLKNCLAVIIVTSLDGPGTPVLAEFLDPLCDAADAPASVLEQPLDQLPYTTKFSTGVDASIERIAQTIGELFGAFTDGFTNLTNWGAIEFAASHDFPLLIVGESGTGKENIAIRVHNRWCQEQERSRSVPSGAGRAPTNELTTVNCAGLTAEMAYSLLFGHIEGAFTSAYASLGKIPYAAGLRFPTNCVKPRGVNAADHYRGLLLGQNAGLLAEEYPGSYNLRFRDTKPLGTLFLDEFAELSPEAAVSLLRYLQTAEPGRPRSFEFQPLGYPGVITGGRIRVVAATSDPAVARLAGVNDLLGTWRSDKEQLSHLRHDLVFRVMGQVIRAEPIRSETALAVVGRLVTAGGGHWSDEAINRLGEKVVDHIERIESGSAASDGLQPVFGHYRQVGMLIRLINAYVATARFRGIRSITSVTPTIVDRLWRTSTVLPWPTGLGTGSISTPPTAQQPVRQWTLEDLAEHFKPGSKQMTILSLLYPRMDDDRPDVSVQELVDATSSVAPSTESVTDAVAGEHETRGATALKPQGGKDLHNLVAAFTRLRERLKTLSDLQGCDLFIPDKTSDGYRLKRRRR